jgi:hypothetical protein
MLENITQLSLLVTVLLLLLVAYIYVFFHLRTLREALETLAYRLYFETTRKADLLPLAIERLRTHNGEYSFEGIIEARRATLAQNRIGSGKRRLEETLWQNYGTIQKESLAWPGVKQDHLLAAVNRRLKEADLDVERARENYNRLAGRYNKLAGNWLFKPAALAAGAGKRELF